MMNVHDFTLVLEGVNDKTPGLEDILFEAGCDDALINCKNSTVFLDFSRESDNFKTAILSAIKAVESTPLGIRVVRILPDDFVSISDIAKRVNTDRQLVSMWVKGERRERRNAHFPSPVLRLTEKSPLWRWYSVVQWLFSENIVSDVELLEYAKFLENANAALAERNSGLHQERNEILHTLTHLQDRTMFFNHSP